MNAKGEIPKRPDVGTKRPQNPLPSIGDDEGTPFAVGVIPVDDGLSIKARAK